LRRPLGRIDRVLDQYRAVFLQQNVESYLVAQGGAVHELRTLAVGKSELKLDIQPLPFNRLHALRGARQETLAVMWRLRDVEASRI
jgi:hypothetical protein